VKYINDEKPVILHIAIISRAIRQKTKVENSEAGAFGDNVIKTMPLISIPNT
jgi:hypothetical protein